MKTRNIGVRSWVVVACAALAVSLFTACVAEEDGEEVTPSIATTALATPSEVHEDVEHEHDGAPSLPGDRSRLMVCVSLPETQKADADGVRARVKAAITRLGPRYPEWAAAFGDDAVVDPCPRAHIAFPKAAPNLSAGILANGEVLGQRLAVAEDVSPYRTFVFVDSDVPMGYEVAPLEWHCASLHQCAELTNALFVDDEVAASEERLADALALAFGMGDPRAPDSRPPGGSDPKPGD